MNLKKKSRIKKKKKFFYFNTLLYINFILTTSIVISFLIFFFTSYTVKVKTDKILEHLSKAGRYEYIYIFDIAWMAFKSNFSKLEKINMEIDFENILIIENTRNKAIKEGTLGNKDDLPRVKAKMIYKEKKINSEVRLKGDRHIHYIDKDKSSYKIELKKNKYILGVNKFSIHKPGVRNYIHEWIFHEMMGDFGLIKLKYEFFDFYINGTSQGLYVLEEGMGKELLERNKRRNGPIFSILEESSSLDNPVFQVYNKKFWNEPKNILIAKTARQKLIDFLNGQRSIEDTFDIEKFAAFFAVLDATYTYHGMFFNSKLYYNPINGFFEPVPFDGHRQLPNYHKFNKSYYNRMIIDSIDKPEAPEDLGLNLQINESRWFFLNKFFSKNGELNKSFYNLYISYLDKISSDNYINSFLEKRKKDIDKINSHIYSDYFFYSSSRDYGSGLYYFLEDDLIHRIKVIRDRINPEKKFIKVIKNDNKFLIKVSFFYCNTCGRNIKKYQNLLIKNIICEDKDVDNQTTKLIPINKQLNVFTYTVITVSKNELDNLNCTHFEFLDRIQDKTFFSEIDFLNSKYNFNDIKQENPEIISKYFVNNNKKLFLKKNEVIIDEDFYIPGGYRIIIKPGQKIYLINNAFIISNSPWSIGDNEGEVIISGKEDNFGGGLLITDSKEKSLINNTKFSYLTGAKKHISSQFIIFGSVNFNQTQVELNNVIFDKIYSEDAINFFRSSIKLKDVIFSDNVSDAIDVDFSDGQIEQVNFINIGNDAIDFSGSNIKIKDVFFENIGDKLISVGENSNIKISNIKANKSHIGIASKDGSIVNIKDIDLDYVNIPFAAYQKKNEYGFGKMNLENYNLKNFYTKWITDGNSKIIANGLNVGEKTKDILAIVDGKNLKLLNL